MAQNGEKKGVLPQIITAVVITLLVGGSAPWWWKELFDQGGKTPPQPTNAFVPNPAPNPTPKPAPVPPPAKVAKEAMTVTAAANPAVISSGQQTAISVYVQDAQGRPLSAATVTCTVGGGRFKRTGTATVSGLTDFSGIFQAQWSCDNCASSYEGAVRVTKADYQEGKAQWRVEIH